MPRQPLNAQRPPFSAKRPQAFPRQFAIFKKQNAIPLPSLPQSYRRHAGQTLICAACPSLPVIELHAPSGQPVGFILGDAIDLDAARFLRAPVTLEASAANGIDTAVDRLHQRLGGHFLILIDGFGRQETYLDACGTMSLVFDPEKETAAATAGLLLDDDAYAARFDHTLYRHLNVLRDGWFPAGLTAHKGIVRQLVNHRLDFSTMQQSRHWPSRQIAITEDPDAAIEAVCTATRAAIDAMRADGPFTMCLTGGNETRMLLALCRDIAPELNFITVAGPETMMDVTVAERLSLRFHLNHRRLPVVRAGEHDAAEWHARAGHAIGGSNMWTHPSVAPLADKGAFAGGLGGEIGRAFFWRPADNGQSVIDPATITARFGMPPHPRVSQAVTGWHPSVEPFDPYLRLDLAYLELRMGCWGFAQAYCMPDVFHTHPMISRRAFANMLALPPEWRRSNRLITRAIERHWPELLDIPFNRFGDYRDTLRMVRRAVREPHLIIKKARKRFA